MLSILLLTARSIAAFTHVRFKSKVIPNLIIIHRNRRLTTTSTSSTPNKNELAKQALSDYIENIRYGKLLYDHHSRISIEGSGKSIVIINKCNGGSNSFVWDPRIYKYNVAIVKKNPCYDIGFASPRLLNDAPCASLKYGLFLCLYSGTLYRIKDDPPSREYIRANSFKVGDIITCIYNASTSEISYEKNGVSLGVAFTNVNIEGIVPAVILSRGNSATISVVSFTN